MGPGLWRLFPAFCGQAWEGGHMCVCVDARAKQRPQGAAVGWCFLVRPGGRWGWDWGLQKLGSPSHRIHGELGEGLPGGNRTCPALAARVSGHVAHPAGSVPPPPFAQPTQNQERGESWGPGLPAGSKAGRRQRGRCCPPPHWASGFHLCFYQAWPEHL